MLSQNTDASLALSQMRESGGDQDAPRLVGHADNDDEAFRAKIKEVLGIHLQALADLEAPIEACEEQTEDKHSDTEQYVCPVCDNTGYLLPDYLCPLCD